MYVTKNKLMYSKKVSVLWDLKTWSFKAQVQLQNINEILLKCKT